ncbi:MAG: hypothetical protein FWE97_04545 [Dehalococcoidia bacterium]|nr:hypothetical protein [Dehalococcoidia bacterium]
MGLKRLANVFLAACILSLLSSALILGPISAADDYDIKVTPQKVLPGGVVTVSGWGYNYLEEYVVVAWSTNPIPTSVAIQPDGTFSISREVPVGFPSGTRVDVWVTCLKHQGRGGSYEVVDSLPDLKITLSDYAGSLGSIPISITGTGFAEVPMITVDGEKVETFLTNPSISSSGTLSARFNLRSERHGERIIKVTDVQTNDSASASFTVLPPKVEFSRSSGAVGTIVDITGSGYFPGSAVSVSMKSASQTVQTLNGTASSSGTVNFDMMIADGIGGEYVIEVNDAYDNSASGQFSITPDIAVVPTSGGYNDTIEVRGTGFGSNRSIAIAFNSAGITLSPAIRTDQYGSFFGSFKLPMLLAGSATIEISDGESSVTKSFIVVPKIVSNPPTSAFNPGHVGMEITITCFGESNDVKVAFDNKQVGEFTLVNNGDGSFDVSFKIPAATGKDKYTISVSVGGTAYEIEFFMEKTPPHAVTLLSPDSNASPKQPLAFVWGPVSDDSGVVYTLQVSKDHTFATWLLEKTDLVDASYKMSDAEKLQNTDSDAPYYWRVMAVDLAGNEGHWSEIRSFTIGSAGSTQPAWAAFVLWGAGAALGIASILVLGLWLGRRMAYKAY